MKTQNLKKKKKKKNSPFIRDGVIIYAVFQKIVQKTIIFYFSYILPLRNNFKPENDFLESQKLYNSQYREKLQLGLEYGWTYRQNFIFLKKKKKKWNQNLRTLDYFFEIFQKIYEKGKQWNKAIVAILMTS